MKKWYTIVIAILAIIILIQYCTRPEKGKNPITKIVPKEIVIEKEYQPKPEIIIQPGEIIYRPGKTKYDTTRIYDTTFLPKNIDTIAILFQYFEKAIYKDTLQNDSIAFIFIQDTISENRILSRKKIIRIKPILYTEKPKRKIYAGIGLGGNMNQFSFAAQILYIDRRERIYGIGYDPVNRITQLSIYWKIKFRQK
jgi:hypothetical protein